MREKLTTLTKKDLSEMIEIACYKNMAGFNRSMLKESKQDMIEFIIEELDEDQVEELYYDFLESN